MNISEEKSSDCIEKDEHEHGHVITFKEQRLILKEIGIPKYLYFFRFCCCTGMRVAEALSIKTKNINKRRRLILIDLPDSKTKKHKRAVPFLPWLFDGMDLSGELLFPDVTDDGSQQYFCRLYKELGLDLTRHSTRHTFISICHHIGIADEIIMDWVGHLDAKMTTGTYTHDLPRGTSPILDYMKKLKQSLGIKTTRVRATDKK